jgi:hypothetical protein
MLSATLPQANDYSPYRAIRTRQTYLRLLNLRRLKARPDRTPAACQKVASLQREGVYESR